MFPQTAATSPGRYANQSSTTDLRSALARSLAYFHGLQSEVGFVQLCHERLISRADTSDRHYWEAVADYAASSLEESEARGLPEQIAILDELVASTPDYVFRQDFLDQHVHSRRHQQRVHQAKEVASFYNSLLRMAAEDWPDITIADLSSALLEACRSITDHHVRASAPQQLWAAIRGAQHEVIFGQLLAHTDRTYHDTSVNQDLKGVDYTVIDPDGREQYIDVKTSLHDIIQHGGSADQPYAVIAGNHLVMYSLVQDFELDGRFYLPEELARQRGAYLQHLLDQALHHGKRRSHWRHSPRRWRHR